MVVYDVSVDLTIRIIMSNAKVQVSKLVEIVKNLSTAVSRLITTSISDKQEIERLKVEAGEASNQIFTLISDDSEAYNTALELETQIQTLIDVAANAVSFPTEPPVEPSVEPTVEPTLPTPSEELTDELATGVNENQTEIQE